MKQSFVTVPVLAANVLSFMYVFLGLKLCITPRFDPLDTSQPCLCPESSRAPGSIQPCAFLLLETGDTQPQRRIISYSPSPSVKKYMYFKGFSKIFRNQNHFIQRVLENS